MKNYTSKQLNEVFALFCGKEEYRPVMHKPFEVDGFVYATDAHVLVRIIKDRYKLKLDNPHKPLNLSKISFDFVSSEKLKLNKKDFDKLKTKDELKEVGNIEKCDSCDGFGEVEWEFESYTRDFDCPVCDGEGKIGKSEKIPTGEKTFGDIVIEIDGKYFNPNFIDKIFTVKDLVGGDIIFKKTKDMTGLFQVKDFEIIIMPLMNDGGAEIYKTK